MTLGQFIQQLRTEKKYSQRKLALLSDLSNTTISRIESDTVVPDLESLEKIASALKVDVGSLISYRNNTCENTADIANLSNKEQKDIAKDLEKFKEELLESDSLMFDGEPLSDESMQSILSAIEIGMQMVRQKNKAKYTPKKYLK
ncbi:MAG: helix-turn-helix domain-containing protein [Cellulosilyticaceae bacterium]